jgi:glycosyltransferase involved in cell wall biosynthesis
MIYLDVTGGCRLPLQTGIPRTTRELFSGLRRHLPDLLPVAWQPFSEHYTRLSPMAERILGDPFGDELSRRRPPSDSTLPIMAAALNDMLRHAPGKIRSEKFVAPDATLLITSIFPDNRLEYLLRLKGSAGRRLAIFHDAIPLGDPAVRGWIRSRHVKSLEVFASMDLVICVSEASERVLRRLWADHGISPTQTHVLPWPVPIDGARPAWSEASEREASVLCVGRLKRLKNQSLLLDAADILWEEGWTFSLILVGCEDVPEESRSLKRQIKRLQGKGRSLHWRGHVSDKELRECYQRALFTVFPSLEEGFGLPIVESLWHGRPVICGLDEPMASLGRGPGCLLANMRSAVELADAMRGLFSHLERTRELARQAHGRPLRTWEDYLPEFTAILREVLLR